MIKVNGRMVTCPENHTNVWRKGSSPSIYGHRQRYVCLDCGRSFHADQGVEKWPPKGASKPVKPPRFTAQQLDYLVGICEHNEHRWDCGICQQAIWDAATS